MSYRRLLALVAVLLSLAACDATPGPPEANAPPTLSGFQFSPDTLRLEDPAPGGTVDVPLTFEVEADDPDGDLERLLYSVRPALRYDVALSPGGPQDDTLTLRAPLVEEVLEVAPDGEIVEVDVPLTLPECEVGLYVVEVFAVDAAGQLSGAARGNLVFEAPGPEPVVTEVAAPEQIPLPEEDAIALFPITAQVDAGGATCLNRVAITGGTLEGGELVFSEPIELEDDGNAGGLSGDERRGDGVYTTLFPLLPGQLPAGTLTLEVQAFNRAGTAGPAATVSVELVEDAD